MKDSLGTAISKAIDATIPKPSCESCGGVEARRLGWTTRNPSVPERTCAACGLALDKDGFPCGMVMESGELEPFYLHTDGADGESAW